MKKGERKKERKYIFGVIEIYILIYINFFLLPFILLLFLHHYIIYIYSFESSDLYLLYYHVNYQLTNMLLKNTVLLTKLNFIFYFILFYFSKKNETKSTHYISTTVLLFIIAFLSERFQHFNKSISRNFL